MNSIDIFNDFSIFDCPIFEIDKNLKNFKKYNVAINNFVNVYPNAIDADYIAGKLILSEVETNIYKSIFKSICQSSNQQFIDFIDKCTILDMDFLMSEVLKIIIDSKKYEYMIVGYNIASRILTSHYSNEFKMIDSPKRKTNLPYEIGEIFNTKIFLDPTIGYDNRIFLLNKIYLNFRLEFFGLSVDTYVGEFLSDNKQPDSMIIYILEDETSIGTSEYKKFKRDKKIEKIIGKDNQ